MKEINPTSNGYKENKKNENFNYNQEVSKYSHENNLLVKAGKVTYIIFKYIKEFLIFWMLPIFLFLFIIMSLVIIPMYE